MRTTLIVRVLDSAGLLLAWASLPAEARGDGQLWPISAPRWQIEQAGTPARLSVHWPDVHVEANAPLTGIASVMDIVIPPFRIGNPPSIPLAPVTVRAPVAIGVPVGAVGTRS